MSKILIVTEKPHTEREIKKIISNSSITSIEDSERYEIRSIFNKPLLSKYKEIEHINTYMLGFLDFKYPSNKKYKDYPIVKDVEYKTKKLNHSFEENHPHRKILSIMSKKYFEKYDDILIATDPDETGIYAIFSALELYLGKNWRSVFNNVYFLNLMSYEENYLNNEFINTLNNEVEERYILEKNINNKNNRNHRGYIGGLNASEVSKYIKKENIKNIKIEKIFIDENKQKLFSIKLSMKRNNYFYEHFNAMYKRAKIKKYFEYNFNLNSLIFQQEIFKYLNINNRIKYLSKYSLMIFHIINNQCNITDKEVFNKMEKWEGSGKYGTNPIGTVVSRHLILETLYKLGLIEKSIDKIIQVTVLGKKLKNLLTKVTFDPDLNSRIKNWQNNFIDEEEVKKEIDNYIKKVFLSLKKKNKYLLKDD